MTCCSNGVILIEYLSNTAALTAPRTFLCCLPLKVSTPTARPRAWLPWRRSERPDANRRTLRT